MTTITAEQIAAIQKAADALESLVVMPRLLAPEGVSDVSDGYWQLRQAAQALTALQERVEGLEGELAEAVRDRNAHADHVLKIASEARAGFDALEEIDACWDACGYPSNRQSMSLSEQISANSREREAAEARADALSAELEGLKKGSSSSRDHAQTSEDRNVD